MNDPISRFYENLAASLLQTDGTFSTVTGEPVEFDYGYQVGGVVPTLIDPTQRELVNWLKRHAITHPDIPFFGSWTDPDTGERHIDASQYERHRTNAMALALARGEKAIWNWYAMDATEVHDYNVPAPSGCV